MVCTPMYFFLILATVEVLVVTGETGSQVSRQERSDDGGPLEAVVEHLSQQVTSLNGQLTSANAKISTLEAKQNALERTVAFSVSGGATPVVATAQGRILINQVQLNIGGAFDPQTGYFTAPVSGIYLFHAEFMVANPSSHDQVWADIFVDGHAAAHAISDSSHGSYDDTTMQIVVHVSAGQTVYVRNPISSVKSYYGGSHLTFSGFLLRAD